MGNEARPKLLRMANMHHPSPRKITRDVLAPRSVGLLKAMSTLSFLAVPAGHRAGMALSLRQQQLQRRQKESQNARRT